MQTELLIEPPKAMHFAYAKFFSPENVAYNYFSSPVVVPETLLDTIDASLRIMCSFLMQQGLEVLNYGSQTKLDTSELKDLYNSLKRDEKAVRSSGLRLEATDGRVETYKNARYRIAYSSYEHFARDFYKNMQNNYVIFRTRDDALANRLQGKDVFQGNLQHQKTGDYTNFMIYFDAGEREFANLTWREYTQALVKLLR